MPRYASQGAKPRKPKRDMAVRPGPRPVANRSQMGLLIAIAVVVTLALAMLSSARANNLPATPQPEALISFAAPSTASGTTTQPVNDSGSQPVIIESTPTPEPTPVPTRLPDDHPRGPWVGIVAGHWGNDSGAVCPDGTTEVQTNLEIAKRVVEKLRAHGIWTDLLQEFDGRLTGYSADVLLSIHADSCVPVDADPPASGYKVARSIASAMPGTEDVLVDCLKSEYAKATNMYFHENSITPDMTLYHSFAEIDADTPAAIVETGFLHLDYDIIVKQPDLPATGIANGLLCFLGMTP